MSFEHEPVMESASAEPMMSEAIEAGVNAHMNFIEPGRAADLPIIINPKFTPIWKQNIPAEEYHADKTAVNCSLLKWILTSPFAFQQMLLGNYKTEETQKMRIGTLAHMKILEGPRFQNTHVVMPEFKGFTKEGKESNRSADALAKKAEWITEQELAGRTIVTPEQLDKLNRMLESVMANADAVKLLKSGYSEVSGYFADPATGILCRFRPDHLNFDLGAQVHVKTVSNLDLDWFRKNRVEDNDFMYYFEIGMYDAGAAVITPELALTPIWLLIESEYPYECIVVPVEEVYREIGAITYCRAMKTLKSCIDQRHFPRRQPLQALHPSHWFMEKQKETL